MESLVGRTQDTLRRSQTFMLAHTDVLGSVDQWTAFQAVGTAITELSAQAANQQAGAQSAKGETARQVDLRQTLRLNYMTPVATVAKVYSASLPEATDLRMPPSNANAAQLVAAANGMAQAVTANLAVFTGAGLSSEIATQLQTAAAAVTASVDTRAKSRGTRVQATSALLQAVKSGRDALRVLDSIVTPLLQGSPLLAQWKSTIKVNAKPGASAGTVVPPAANTTVTTTTTAEPAPLPAGGAADAAAAHPNPVSVTTRAA